MEGGRRGIGGPKGISGTYHLRAQVEENEDRQVIVGQIIMSLVGFALEVRFHSLCDKELLDNFLNLILKVTFSFLSKQCVHAV